VAKNKPKSAKQPDGPVIENRRARFDFAISDTVEAGMILRGSEVKSIRDGKASLQEGYVRVEFGGLRGGPKTPDDAPAAPAAPGAKPKPIVRRRVEPGLYLHGVNIAEYPPAGPPGSPLQHKPTRVRTLLVHGRELARLAREVQLKGFTLVPLKIYFKNGKAKLLVGLGKSKTHQDKRASITKREQDRDIARAMSRRG
jgi:SsrA-binding protein